MKSYKDLCCCALFSKFVLCSQHQAVSHAVGLWVTGWNINTWKSQTLKKNLSILRALVSYHSLSYSLSYKKVSLRHFMLLLTAVSWKFQRFLNSNAQWADRHLSSPDIPEAMTSRGWFGTGWLIRYSLLLRPPIEVLRRMFAGYSCLLILSQIQIS